VWGCGKFPKRNKKEAALEKISNATVIFLAPNAVHRSISGTPFSLDHGWFSGSCIGEQRCSCVRIPPSQVSPVTGSLHEYKLLHIQQRVKLRTLTGFPNLPHLSFPTVIVGDAMQLMKFHSYPHPKDFRFRPMNKSCSCGHYIA
jgi:hypothetical protein